MAMRVWMRVVVLVGAAAAVVAGPMSAAAGAAEVYGRGTPIVARAITMQFGDTYYDGSDSTDEERLAQPSGGDLYRIAPVYRGDVLVFRLTSVGNFHDLCIVDESVATQRCSYSPNRVFDTDGPTQVTVRATASIARPMLRVEGPGQFTVTFVSRQRPLTLAPYIYARGQRTDVLRVTARTSVTTPAPDGLPCQALVVGPEPGDRFTYRTTVAKGQLAFAMSLPARLHGRTVGYLVTCDGSPAVAGSSFEVVVK